MKTSVLVTGANGQLAKSIKVLFEQNDDDVNYSFANRSQLDITSDEDLISHFKSHSYDYIVNCAAYTNVDGAEESSEEAFEINAEALKKLGEHCYNRNMILIHISTDYVFDGTKLNAYDETDAVNPINIYGKSKLKGEQNVQSTTGKHFIIRTSWLYSPYGKNFLKTISSLIQQNKTLEIVDSQKGSPTSCFELAKFIHFIICHPRIEFGVYHFAAKNATTWYGFAKYIASFYPDYKQSRLRPVSKYKTKAARPKNSVLSLNKTEKIYNDIQTWEAGVEHIMQSIK